MNQNDYNRDYSSNTYRHAVVVSDRSAAEAARTFMNRVYLWMAGALAVTGLVAYAVFGVMMDTRPHMTITGEIAGGSIFWSPGFMLVMVLVEFGLVIWLSAGVNKMNPMVAGISFLAFSVVNGITLAPIFFCYTQSAIYSAFFTCAGMFAVTSIFGYITRADLTGVGSFCMMGLFGIIIATIVNWFMKSEGLDTFIAYAGVFIFLGLTAWDTQKLKQAGGYLGSDEMEGTDYFHKFAILGALELYLDFINLFLMLLRLFGRSRD